MSQCRLHLQTSEREANAMLDLLEDIFEDDGYAMATTEIDEERDIWELSLYVPADDKDRVMERLDKALRDRFGSLGMEAEILPDIDWVSKSLEGLRPVRAGRFIVHGSHDRHEIRPGCVGIEIDAGQAFGTGHHGTTAGCLEMIEAVLKRRSITNALDLGTGSGVLALAIRKLRPAVPILATDIDPIAIRVARYNSKLNQGGRGIGWRVAAGFHDPAFAAEGPFDLVVANILARPLMAMAPALVTNLAAGGEVILSGILAEQRWKVLSAFNAQGLAHRKTLWRDGWVTLHLA